MKVKLSMLSFSYKENESKKAITCIVKAKSRIGAYVRDITAVGIAKCDDKDTYDVEKGKRVARAKAELEAYLQHKNRLYEWLRFLDRQIEDASFQYQRVQGYISHQKEYIKSF